MTAGGGPASPRRQALRYLCVATTAAVLSAIATANFFAADERESRARLDAPTAATAPAASFASQVRGIVVPAPTPANEEPPAPPAPTTTPFPAPAATPTLAPAVTTASPATSVQAQDDTLAPAFGTVESTGAPRKVSRRGRIPATPQPLPPDVSGFAEAINTSRREGDRCVAPIVCQRGVPCAATNAGIDLAACDWALPPLDPAIASTAKVAMVEVGTNQGPETAKLGLDNRTGWYNVAVDPLHREGQILWGEGLAAVLVSAAVTPTRGAMNFSLASVMSSVSSVKAASSGRGSGGGGAQQPAATLPLSAIVEKMVPADVDARLLLVDAQGFDTAVVLSAGAEQLRRFRYVVIECQELWPDHPKRYSPNSPNCSEAAGRLEAEGGLVFLACMRNIAMSEYNCVFAQKDHPVVAVEGGLEKARAAIASLQLQVQQKRVNPWTMRPSYSIQQLHHLVPDPQDATDLSTVMCYMYNQPKPPNCPVITRLGELLEEERVCRYWAAMCNRPRGGPEPRCRANVALRCGTAYFAAPKR